MKNLEWAIHFMLRFNESYSCMEMELGTWLVCGGNNWGKPLSCTLLSSLYCIPSHWFWDRILLELQLNRVRETYFNIQLLNRKRDSIIIYCQCFLVGLGKSTPVVFMTVPEKNQFVYLGHGWWMLETKANKGYKQISLLSFELYFKILIKM